LMSRISLRRWLGSRWRREMIRFFASLDKLVGSFSLAY
jgi:hypothetical protein